MRQGRGRLSLSVAPLAGVVDMAIGLKSHYSWVLSFSSVHPHSNTLGLGAFIAAFQ